jgi:hypothetical protein
VIGEGGLVFLVFLVFLVLLVLLVLLVSLVSSLVGFFVSWFALGTERVGDGS